MRLYESTLAVDILDYLNRVGGIPRKQLYTPFSEYSYRYYASIVKRLLDESYLESYSYNRINHVRLTSGGLNALIEKTESSKEIKNQSAKADSPKKKKRLLLVADVIGLCKAAGFLIDEKDKPLLEDLFDRGAAPIPDTQKATFERSLKTGLFYSSGEIRKAYTNILGRSEIANWSRLVGIVFFGKNLSFLYGVGGNLIQWRTSCEDRTIKHIVSFLLKSDIIKNNITFYEHPNCIICGRGYTLIPKIIYGRKWGKISEEKRTENFHRVIARDHINSHNLAKVFSSAYYVTVNKDGVDNFKLATMLDKNTKERLCDKWFDKRPTVSRVKTFAYHQGWTSKRERVVYMPYVDLIELEFYKNQGVACHFVLLKGTQDAVSRVMGPLFLSAKSLDGSFLKYKQYDANGAPYKNK